MLVTGLEGVWPLCWPLYPYLTRSGLPAQESQESNGSKYHHQNHGVKSQRPRTWAWAPSLSTAVLLVGEGQ